MVKCNFILIIELGGWIIIFNRESLRNNIIFLSLSLSLFYIYFIFISNFIKGEYYLTISLIIIFNIENIIKILLKRLK